MEKIYVSDSGRNIFEAADMTYKTKRAEKAEDSSKKEKKERSKQQTKVKAKKKPNTADNFLKQEAEKLERKKARKRKEYECEMIRLLARREYIVANLNRLDPRKKKDAKKIAALNAELIWIEKQIGKLEEESGLERIQLKSGTKRGRFFWKVKRRLKKIWKKTKSFCKENAEVIVSVIAVALPSIISLFTKKPAKT